MTILNNINSSLVDLEELCLKASSILTPVLRKEVKNPTPEGADVKGNLTGIQSDLELATLSTLNHIDHIREIILSICNRAEYLYNEPRNTRDEDVPFKAYINTAPSNPAELRRN